MARSQQETRSYKINKTRVVWVCGAILLFSLLLFATQKKNEGVISGVEVEIIPLANEENVFITESDIKTIIKNNFDGDLINTQLSRANVARIESVLKQDPFIDRVETYVDASNLIHVKVYQRKPFCRIIDNENRQYYLSEKGDYVPLSKHYTSRVIVVTGAISNFSADYLTNPNYKGNLRDIYNLVKLLTADKFFQPLVQQIYIDANSEFTLVPNVGEQKIRIGDFNDIDDKFNRIKIFYREAMPYTGWNTYSSISVKFKGQIVCKK